MEGKKSIITAVFGWFFILYGIYGFVDIVLHFLFFPLQMSETFSIYDPLLNIGEIIVGLNLLRYKNWARLFVMFSCWISLTYILYNFFTVHISSQMLGSFILFNISSILFVSSGLYYFTRPKTKGQFK